DLHDFTVSDGSYVEGARKALAVMVKDSKKYASTGGCGFQLWEGGDPKKPLVTDAAKQCFECHQPKKIRTTSTPPTSRRRMSADWRSAKRGCDGAISSPPQSMMQVARDRSCGFGGRGIGRAVASCLLIPSFTGSDPYEPSLPGLTRQSIFLQRQRFSKMDTRVKPAYDESLIATAA
ncbi:MAG: cytochrome P460 family protein, partial [Rhodoplanes sp.]